MKDWSIAGAVCLAGFVMAAPDLFNSSDPAFIDLMSK